MLNDNLKNIVVLKNLPSNIIDEAIVILKSKKNARKLELIEKNSVINYKKRLNNNDYIIKEAESVISNYIAKLEKNGSIEKTDNMEKKYKKVKAYSIFLSILLFFIFIKFFI